MRRCTALLACLVVAAASAALVPTAARAAVVPAGSLEAGTATTVVLAGQDVATYLVDVPAGARPSLTVSAVDEALNVDTELVYSDEPVPRSGGTIVAADPGARFAEFVADPTGAATTAELRLSCGSCDPSAPAATMTFTLHLAEDTSRTVSSGELVTLTFTEPGQQVRLPLDTVGGPSLVSVWVEADDLSSVVPAPTGPRLSVREVATGQTLFQDPPGHFRYCCRLPAHETLVVDPAGALTGTVILRVNAPGAGTTELPYSDDSGFVTLDQAGTADGFFEARAGARTLVHVIGSSLQHSDGTPGSATLQLLVPGEPAVTLGTVTRAKATFAAPAALEPRTGVTLRFVGDADTTGGVSLGLRLDPGPSTPIPYGMSTLAVAAGADHALYGLTAQAGDRLELYFDPVTSSAPTSPAVSVLSEYGEVMGSARLSAADPAAIAFVVPANGRYDVRLDAPAGTDVSVVVTAVAGRTVASSASAPVNRTLTLSAAGENQELTVPTVAGETYGVTVTDESLTGAPAGGPAAFVTVSPPAAFPVTGPQPLAAGGSTFAEVGPVASGEPLRILVDGNQLATGAVHVSVTTPAVHTGTLPDGSPTTVTVPERGGSSRYTFEGTDGAPFALDVTGAVLTSSGFPLTNVVLQRPDGSVVAALQTFNGDRAWFDTTLDATGTWSVVVDPFGDTTGSVVLTRITPRTLTSAITPGATTTVTLPRPADVARLTFAGRAGQRPVITTSDATVLPRMQLVSPTGLVTFDNASFGFGDFLEAPVLTTSGTWTLVLDPDQYATGSLRLRLSLLTDPVRTVTSGQSVTTSFVAGQNPTFRVRAAAGRTIALAVTRSTPEVIPNSSVRILRPDGSTAWDGPMQPSGWVEMPTQTDMSGTWAVVLDPTMATRGKITSAVHVARDTVLTGRVGRATSVSVTTPAQNVLLPFDVPVGSAPYLRYEIRNASFKGPGYRLRLVTPSGTDWVTTPLLPAGSSSGVIFAPMDIDGRWTLVVDPYEGSTASAKLTFSLVDRPF